jgi:hypothetical protein
MWVFDVLPLPVVILLGALAAFAAAVIVARTVIPAIRRRSLRARSRRWPTVRARLDHACVTEYRPSDTEITFRLDAWFTYSVGGKDYEGTYENPEMRLEEAKALLKRLNHEPLLVSYNPAKPGEYFYEPPARAQRP